jgi:hypothetical protein
LQAAANQSSDCNEECKRCKPTTVNEEEAKLWIVLLFLTDGELDVGGACLHNCAHHNVDPLANLICSSMEKTATSAERDEVQEV